MHIIWFGARDSTVRQFRTSICASQALLSSEYASRPAWHLRAVERRCQVHRAPGHIKVLYHRCHILAPGVCRNRCVGLQVSTPTACDINNMAQCCTIEVRPLSSNCVECLESSHRRGSVEQEVGRRSSLEPRLRGVGGSQVCGGRPQDNQVRQLLQRVLEVLVAHLHPKGCHINSGAMPQGQQLWVPAVLAAADLQLLHINVPAWDDDVHRCSPFAHEHVDDCTS